MAGLRRPNGLGAAGAKLWTGMTELYDFRPDELAVLESAAREFDIIARLQQVVDKAEALRTKGSMGQDVAIPELGELRQHRALAGQLLARLRLPADEPDEVTQPVGRGGYVTRRAATPQRV